MTKYQLQSRPRIVTEGSQFACASSRGSLDDSPLMSHRRASLSGAQLDIPTAPEERRYPPGVLTRSGRHNMHSSRQKRFGTCGSPAAGRHDDIPDRLRQGQSVLASRHRGGNSVSLVLICPRWHAIQAEGCQCLPAPGRAGSRPSLAVPASPRGSREDLDDLDTARSECVEESKPLKDPGVVGARMHPYRVGCPADSADRPGELEFALASGLSLGHAGTRAVDRDDRRRIRNDEVNDLLACHAALERHDTAIIDDRGVKALPLSAHINADPQCHESKHAPPSTSALWADAEDLAGPRLPSAWCCVSF